MHQHHSIVKAIMTLATVLLAAAMALPAPAYATSGSSSGSSTPSDFSFSAVANAAANYFDIMSSIGRTTQGMPALPKGKEAATAGGLVGYIDKNSQYTISQNFTLTQHAKNITEMDADNYYNNYKSKGSTAQGVADYIELGRLYSATGLDQTTAQAANGYLGSYRRVTSFALYLGWICASAISTLFGWVIKLLRLLNPFGAFTHALAGTGSLGNVNASDGNVFTSTTSGSALATFWGQFVKAAYDVATQFTLPICIVLGIAIWIIARAIDPMSARGRGLSAPGATTVRSWIVRAAFIVFAIPIFGVMYTGMLDSLANVADGSLFGGSALLGSSQANQIVCSTLYDFETAVYGKSAPAGPADFDNLAGSNSDNGFAITLKASGDGSVDDSSYTALHDIVAQSNGINVSGGSGNAGAFTTSWSKLSATDYSGQKYTDLARSLLTSYQNDETLNAASYESAIKSTYSADSLEGLMRWVNGATNPQNYCKNLKNALTDPSLVKGDSDTGVLTGGKVAGFSLTSDDQKAYEDAITEYTKDHDLAKLQETIDAIFAKHAGTGASNSAKTSSDAGGVLFAGDGKGFSFSVNDGTFTVNAGSGVPGISDMAMYNWLSSDFSSGTVRIYSTANSSNDYVAVSHYAVNPIGGLTPFGVVTMLNAVVTLFGFSLVGIVYFLSLLASNVKRGVGLLVSSIPAFAGSLRSIARWLLLATMLVVETVGIIILYQVVCTLFSLVNGFIANELPAGLETAGMHGIMLPITTSLLASGIMIAFIALALNLRSSIIMGVSEQLRAIMAKVVGADGGSDVRTASAGSGLARGAMAALAGSDGGSVARGVAGTTLVAGGAAALLSKSAGGSVNATGSLTAEGGNGADGKGGDATSKSGIEGGDRQVTGKDTSKESSEKSASSDVRGAVAASAQGGEASANGASSLVSMAPYAAAMRESKASDQLRDVSGQQATAETGAAGSAQVSSLSAATAQGASANVGNVNAASAQAGSAQTRDVRGASSAAEASAEGNAKTLQGAMEANAASGIADVRAVRGAGATAEASAEGNAKTLQGGTMNGTMNGSMNGTMSGSVNGSMTGTMNGTMNGTRDVRGSAAAGESSRQGAAQTLQSAAYATGQGGQGAAGTRDVRGSAATGETSRQGSAQTMQSAMSAASATGIAGAAGQGGQGTAGTRDVRGASVHGEVSGTGSARVQGAGSTVMAGTRDVRGSEAHGAVGLNGAAMQAASVRGSVNAQGSRAQATGIAGRGGQATAAAGRGGQGGQAGRSESTGTRDVRGSASQARGLGAAGSASSRGAAASGRGMGIEGTRDVRGQRGASLAASARGAGSTSSSAAAAASRNAAGGIGSTRSAVPTARNGRVSAANGAAGTAAHGTSGRGVPPTFGLARAQQAFADASRGSGASAAARGGRGANASAVARGTSSTQGLNGSMGTAGSVRGGQPIQSGRGVSVSVGQGSGRPSTQGVSVHVPQGSHEAKPSRDRAQRRGQQGAGHGTSLADAAASLDREGKGELRGPDVARPNGSNRGRA